MNDMKKEQIERAKVIAIAKNTRFGEGWDGEKRFFIAGEIVSFTGFSRTKNNAIFEINNDSNWHIWFSQLNMYFLDDNLSTEFHDGTITFHDGTVKEIPDLNPDEFYELVKGKRFRVEIDSSVFGAFNIKSTVWDELSDRYYSTAHRFVVKCIESEDYGKLRDLVKGSNTKCYDFIEVN